MQGRTVPMFFLTALHTIYRARQKVPPEEFW